MASAEEAVHHEPLAAGGGAVHEHWGRQRGGALRVCRTGRRSVVHTHQHAHARQLRRHDVRIAAVVRFTVCLLFGLLLP